MYVWLVFISDCVFVQLFQLKHQTFKNTKVMYDIKNPCIENSVFCYM